MKEYKPFIKWVGGKSQILETVLGVMPMEMEDYHELFVGGGSVLFGILKRKREGGITIRGNVNVYDKNEALIWMYKNIKENPEKVHGVLLRVVNEYDGIKGMEVNRKPESEEDGKSSKESYYYWTRRLYNKADKKSYECSALFIFLNKTCFRGVYREGPNGFNVPYGHYKKTPVFPTLEEWKVISSILKDVHFEVSDYKDSLKKVKEGDFVYMDPPYAPETSKSFTSYIVDGFDMKEHKNLFEMTKKLNSRYLMSNAKVDMVIGAFDEGQRIVEVDARRAIHSKKPDTMTKEVLICNY